jgi:hypothetical protein
MIASDSPSLPRLALALAIAGAILAAICAGIAWGVYALNFDDDYGVASRARFAAMAVGAGMAAFSASAAPLALLALHASKRRSPFAFALAGAAAGPVFLLVAAALTGAPTAPAALIAFAAIGALHLLIARKAAGFSARR